MISDRYIVFNGTLKVKNVKKEAAGVYKCRFFLNGVKQETLISLKVKQAQEYDKGLFTDGCLFNSIEVLLFHR